MSSTPVHKQPPRPRSAPKKKREAADIVLAMQDDVASVERSLAGYNHLGDVLASLTGQAEPGARVKGPPIFTYKASLDGVRVLEISSDLKFISPEHVPHVLTPLIYAHAGQLRQSLATLISNASELEAMLAASLGQQSAHEPEQEETHESEE